MIDHATRSLGVMVVDDQSAFRRAAVVVIEMMDELHVVGEAYDATTALAQAVATDADVAIVDLNLGADSGTDVCRQLRALRPELAVVIVSTTAPEDLPRDVYTCGAAGFIEKSRFGSATLTQALDLPDHLR